MQKHSIPIVQADISANNFRLGNYYHNSFHYTIISEVLEHIPHPEKLLSDAGKLSEWIILSVQNSAFYRYRLGLMFRGRFFTQWIKHPAEHLRFWSNKDFMEWLDAIGFDIQNVQSSNGPHLLKDLWPNMFGHQICYLARKKEGSI